MIIGVAGYACKLNKEKSPKLEIASPEPVAVLGEEEAEIPPRARNEELEMFDFVGRKNIKSILARQTASESKPINIETRSGEGTGEKLEMFEIQGRNNVERKTASEAKPIYNGEKDDLRNPKTAEMVEIKEESEEIKTAEMETEIES